MQVTFTDPVDMSTLDGNIVMYQRAKGSTANDPSAATPVPLELVTGTTLRFDASDCSTPAMIDAVTVIPMVPLDEKSTYTIAVLAGVKTADGQDFLPSFTWALVRQTVDPVTIGSDGSIISNSTPLNPADPTQAPQIVALDGLWKAEATGLHSSTARASPIARRSSSAGRSRRRPRPIRSTRRSRLAGGGAQHGNARRHDIGGQRRDRARRDGLLDAARAARQSPACSKRCSSKAASRRPAT